MSEDNRPFISSSMEDTAHWQKNPVIRGFMAGLSGAILGAGGGGLVNALRGASAGKGALIGGLGVGLLAGLSRAAVQKTENLAQEANLRYHVLRLSDREPLVYMPPPKVFGSLFRGLHRTEHLVDPNVR